MSLSKQQASFSMLGIKQEVSSKNGGFEYSYTQLKKRNNE